MPPCQHQTLFLASLNSEGQYKEPSRSTLNDALRISKPSKDVGNKRIKTRAGKSSVTSISANFTRSPGIFPAPLILPGDELALDPEYLPQSVREWLDEESRTDVTIARRTIYIVSPPSVHEDVLHVEGWATPNSLDVDVSKKGNYTAMKPVPCNESSEDDQQDIPPPSMSCIVDYLQAFYYGLPVKILQEPQLEFTKWQNRKKANEKDSFVGLATGSEIFCVRTRPSPDMLFPRQLNLNDLLDVAISIIPEDAYALLMLVDQDIYENHDDEFCCGRAYGGSRVAVVSTARYRPDIDRVQGQVQAEHAWPDSHCLKYVTTMLDSGAKRVAEKQARKRKRPSNHDMVSAMEAAVKASSAIPLPTSPAELGLVWLGRVCKTASHELGHCFGIDHCTYYACLMQGSASLAEDSRQPPYLCPIDLAKLLIATGAIEWERCEALGSLCERWRADRMFAAFGAWIGAQL